MTNAAESGRFRVGGAFDVNRLGFGAMRIVGRGIWGPPADRAEAMRTLRRLPDLGVDFIDTADSYGPDFSERADPRKRSRLTARSMSRPKAGWREPDRTYGFRSAGPNI